MKRLALSALLCNFLVLPAVYAYDKQDADSTHEASFVEQYFNRGVSPKSSLNKNPRTLDSKTAQDAYTQYFQIPGTPMKIRFFGYVSGTYIYDIESLGSPNTLSPASIGTMSPSIGNANIRFNAARSNFGIEVHTPVPGYVDPLKLVLITGFTPLATVGATATQEANDKQLLSNDESNVIAAAYVELGSFLAGQYATNFMDINSVPEILNFGSNAGAYGIAAPQLKYSEKMGDNNAYTLAIALENPETDYTLVNAVIPHPADPYLLPPYTYFTSGIPSAALIEPAVHDRVPDLTLSLNYQQDWGHLFVSAMVREQRVCGTPITPLVQATPGFVPMGAPRTQQVPIDAHKVSWAANIAGQFKFWGKDNITGHLEYGYGLGRYALGTVTQTSWVDLNKPKTMEQIYSTVGTVAYQHWWNDCFRSTFLYGFVNNHIRNQSPGITNKWIHSGVVNLMYSPTPIVNVGIEYTYMRRTFLRQPVELGVPKDGHISRVEAQVRVYF